MRVVTDAPHDPDPTAPAAVGGERRLARPPSERYRTAPTGAPATAAGGQLVPGDAAGDSGKAGTRPSPARGVAFGSIAAFVGAALIVLLGGAFAISAGLLVVAVAVGYCVGLATVAGAAHTLSTQRRPWIAASLAGLAVVLGQAGLWLYARAEGGVLPPIDYLAQTFGPLVPLELLLAAGMAWWRGR
jgi:hypothetical protein